MFDAVINALSAFANWLLSGFVAVFAALWQIQEDLMIDGLDLLLNGLSSVLSLLPTPTFLSGLSLQSLFGQLGSDMLFFFGQFRVGEGIALVGAAFAFRMARKVVTLFQW
ncbi:DUF2523 family protein [Ralstonia pickettii]|uniref:Minor coat protein n=1 Tax=Ralstonia pickettii TaxID=329 RepID=A0ABM9IS99_RALPI|nr:DUF2523 family protein [Ralstonia pickettii]CAJ0729122.1 hypothetical protein R38712_03938 [Ralstonia pickettii]